MRKTKFKGIVNPMRKVSHTKTFLEEDDPDDLEPAYVKKHFKKKTPCKTLTQLKLFGNPYDMKY